MSKEEALFLVIDQLNPILSKYLEENFNSTDPITKALCTIGSLQIDLFYSLPSLTKKNNDKGILPACVLMRSIIENQGNIRHISSKKSRAEAYINYVEEIKADIAHYVAHKTIREHHVKWTTSYIEQRVVLLTLGTLNSYNFMSNFVHGNNMHFMRPHMELARELIIIQSTPIYADLIHQIIKTIPVESNDKDLLVKGIKQLAA